MKLDENFGENFDEEVGLSQGRGLTILALSLSALTLFRAAAVSHSPPSKAEAAPAPDLRELSLEALPAPPREASKAWQALFDGLRGLSGLEDLGPEAGPLLRRLRARRKPELTSSEAETLKSLAARDDAVLEDLRLALARVLGESSPYDLSAPLPRELFQALDERLRLRAWWFAHEGLTSEALKRLHEVLALGLASRRLQARTRIFEDGISVAERGLADLRRLAVRLLRAAPAEAALKAKLQKIDAALQDAELELRQGESLRSLVLGSWRRARESIDSGLPLRSDALAARAALAKLAERLLRATRQPWAELRDLCDLTNPTLELEAPWTLGKSPQGQAAAGQDFIDGLCEDLTPLILLRPLTQAKIGLTRLALARVIVGSAASREELGAALSGGWPEDPYAEGPLRLELEKERAYTVGPNGLDDGGEGDDWAVPWPAS